MAPPEGFQAKRDEMKKARIIPAIMAAALAGSPALAQPTMRPGLWEQTTVVTSQSGAVEQMMREMQQRLADMPPEQRKMIEQTMAAEGISFDANTQTMRVCITPEQAAALDLVQDEDCTQEVVQRTAKSVKVKFQCAGDPPSSGEGEITFNGPTIYKSQATVNTMVDGRPEQMTMEQSGKWLSGDCGDIHPD